MNGGAYATIRLPLHRSARRNVARRMHNLDLAVAYWPSSSTIQRGRSHLLRDEYDRPSRPGHPDHSDLNRDRYDVASRLFHGCVWLSGVRCYATHRA